MDTPSAAQSTNSKWFDRDRFVLSAGHASMLLHSLLFLSGYDLTMAGKQQFRQWGSRAPRHPEYGMVPGAGVTTGPLGQDVGNAVGLAIAECWLAATFNRSGNDVVNHYTHVMASDGDMMEGVAAEAASLAGQLRLGRLIVLYDANQTTLSAAVCRSACGQWADGDRTKPHWDDTIGLPPADG